MFVKTTKDKSTRSLRSLTHESNNIVNNICSTCDLVFTGVPMCGGVHTRCSGILPPSQFVARPREIQTHIQAHHPRLPYSISTLSNSTLHIFELHVRAEINQPLRTQTGVSKLLLCEPKSLVRRRR